MILNRIEKAMMNNPVRALIQRHFEVERLISMGGRMLGGAALEVGCGRGVGTGFILDCFRAERVDAFDLDPHMVELARERLAPRGDCVRLWVGDAAAIEAEDDTYDAVFDFGILHHVPAWRDALREIRRVLKPRGRFYAEEVLAPFIHHPLWSRVLEHPHEDRFDERAFSSALKDLGFTIIATRRLFGDFAWFVADK